MKKKKNSGHIYKKGRGLGYFGDTEDRIKEYKDK